MVVLVICTGGGRAGIHDNEGMGIGQITRRRTVGADSVKEKIPAMKLIRIEVCYR